MSSQYALCGLALLQVFELEVVRDVDALQDEDLVLLLDLALGDPDETITA